MIFLLLACTGGDTGDSADKTTTTIDPDNDHDGAPASVDCDDENPDIRPAAPETCDGVDEDCNGEIDDEAIDAPLWYTDADGDGYGAPGDFQDVCEAPAGTVDNAEDCDDADAASSPDGTEVCGDAADQDCDGTADDGCTFEGDITTAGAYASLATGNDLLSMRVADLDEDGALDVILAGPDAVGAHFGPLVSGFQLGTTLLESPDGLLGGHITTGDLDDDGVIDLVLAAPSNMAQVYVGGARSLTPAWAELGTGHTGYGATISAADLDADGVDDLLVGTSDATTPGVLGVHLGPIFAGTTTTFDTTWEGVAVGDLAGATAAVVGDTDGDGVNDLLVGAQGYAEGGQSGRAWLVAGPLEAGSFSLADAHTTFVSGSTGAAGTALAGAGDNDGDGYGDVLIGGPTVKSGSATLDVGQAWMFRGPTRAGEVELEDARAIVAGVGASDRCGQSVAGGGDLNGDGAADLAVGCADGASEPKVAVFFGAIPSGTHYFTNGDVVITGEPGFGDALMLPPDLTGDGIDDLLTLETSEEMAWLLPGAR